MILFPLARQRGGRCGSGVPVGSDVCRGCGHVLHSPERLRAAGALYLAPGLPLTSAAAYLLAVVTRVVLRPATRCATREARGGRVLVYGSVGFVLAPGASGLLMSAWQVSYGRCNLKVKALALTEPGERPMNVRARNYLPSARYLSRGLPARMRRTRGAPSGRPAAMRASEAATARPNANAECGFGVARVSPAS